jgi:N-acetylmuramoyl-L-alanine amidase
MANEHEMAVQKVAMGTSRELTIGPHRKYSVKRTVSIAPFCIAALVLSGLWILPIDLHAGKSRSVYQIPSFDKVCAGFERLSKSSVGTRDEWHNVIKSFLAIHEAQRGELSNRSLLFAGRASLALYKRSAKTEDLETALRYLKEYGDLNTKTPHAAIGERELKKAQNLKKRLLGDAEKRDLTLLNAQSAQSSAQIYTAPVQSRCTVQPVNPAVSSISPLGSSSLPKGEVEPSPERPRPIHQGNPYFGRFSRPSVKTQGHWRRASVPSSTMTDGLSPGQVAKKSKTFVVVIDPGHGGKDPGAVSQDGRIKEKDLTLDIAKRLRNRLEKSIPGSRVILTRNDDTSLALSQRTSLANSLNADLFLSIHGNGFGDSRAKGIETFYLSKASSRGSMRVAARENGISLARMSDLEATLLDLMVTSKKTESDAVANIVHSSLVQNLLPRDPSARDRGVKTAPFYVLLGAKMPSILVECAFITNSRDRHRLGSLNYLDVIADGIANGAVKYLRGLDDRA